MSQITVTIPTENTVAVTTGDGVIDVALVEAPLALDLEPIVIAGPAGPRGTWGVDQAFQLRQLSLPVAAGAVTIDLSAANTVFVLLEENVTSIQFTNLPPAGVSVRVQIYVQQDETGGRSFGGWPAGVYPVDSSVPEASPTPHMRSSFVLDTFDGGASVQLSLVGTYGPIT